MTHRFSVTLSFAPKRSSDRTLFYLLNKVLSDERLGAKLRVTENRCVIFNRSTYVYIYIYICIFYRETTTSTRILGGWFRGKEDVFGLFPCDRTIVDSGLLFFVFQAFFFTT